MLTAMPGIDGIIIYVTVLSSAVQLNQQVSITTTKHQQLRRGKARPRGGEMGPKRHPLGTTSLPSSRVLVQLFFTSVKE
jgi:hypothetical protein